MSQKNVESCRRGYEHRNRTGEFLWELIDPEVELHDSPDSPDTQVYRGHEGVRTALANVEESFEELHFEAEDSRDAGDDVVVFIHMRGRGKGSGIEIEAQIAHVWTIREGKGVRIRVLDRETARA